MGKGGKRKDTVLEMLLVKDVPIPLILIADVTASFALIEDVIPLLPLQIEQDDRGMQCQDETPVVLSSNTVLSVKRGPTITITKWAMTVGRQQATRPY